MRSYPILLIFIAVTATAGGNHCSNQEQTIFSCAIAKSSKVVSLCASSNPSKELSGLAYRFGTPGKVKLEFPSSSVNSLQQFRYAHYFRFQTDYTEVSFTIGKITYSIFDYYNGEEKPETSQGVRVSNSDKENDDTELLCSGKVKSELPKLEGIIPCDKNSTLTGCD